MGNILIAAALLFFGAVIGGTFADIDLAPPLPIKHRSAWTHGPLIPFGILYLVNFYPPAWWFAVGFLPAFAVHLVFDMFPKKWHGGAKIKLFPIPGTLPALFSFLFLAVGVGYSGYSFYSLIW